MPDDAFRPKKTIPLTNLDFSALERVMANNRIEKLEITVEREMDGEVVTRTATATLEDAELSEDAQPLFPAMTGVFVLLPSCP